MLKRRVGLTGAPQHALMVRMFARICQVMVVGSALLAIGCQKTKTECETAPLAFGKDAPAAVQGALQSIAAAGGKTCKDGQIVLSGDAATVFAKVEEAFKAQGWKRATDVSGEGLARSAGFESTAEGEHGTATVLVQGDCLYGEVCVILVGASLY